MELERRHPQPRDGRNVAHVVADSVGKHLARQLHFLLRKAPACWDSRQRRWQPVRHRNPTNSLSIESQTCFAKGNFSWNAMSCKDDLASAQAAEFAVAFTDHAHLCRQSACISECRSCWVIFANVHAARLSASCNKIAVFIALFSKDWKAHAISQIMNPSGIFTVCGCTVLLSTTPTKMTLAMFRTFPGMPTPSLNPGITAHEGCLLPFACWPPN